MLGRPGAGDRRLARFLLLMSAMSRKPTFGPDVLARSLRELVPRFPEAELCIAFSGGVDSVAMLHAAVKLAQGEPRLALRAIHVDHGLQAASVEWARLCASTCDRMGVRLDVLRPALVLRKGDSIEAQARRVRYAALAEAMAPGEFLLTAHHADDQLETVLLQLFRGAGVRGLSGMPRSAPLGEGFHLRPLLDAERADLVAYVRAAGLDWIDDPMNAQTRYDRSWLRHHVLPSIRQRWPSVAHTVGRSARHMAHAERLNTGLAELDAAPLIDDGRLEIAGLRSLPRERQVNVLRWWLAGEGLGVPSAARLESILCDVVPARDDAQPVVTWPNGEVRRYRGRLHAMQPLGPPPAGDWLRHIRIGETVDLPCGLGRLSVVPSSSPGILIDEPDVLAVTFRSRTAAYPRDEVAETCRRAAVLPWMRGRLPLISHGGLLLAVGSIATNSRPARTEAGYGLTVRWEDGPRYR